MQIGLISDTHGKLRPEVFDIFRGVELILHAGDIGSLDIITELEAIAPVHAVHGNTDDFDVRAKYGESVALDLLGLRVAMTHGHLLGSPTPALLRNEFPQTDIVVYGHTHIPKVDRNIAPILVNPGAAGPARFKLKPSVALLQLPQLEIEHVYLP